MAFVITPEFGRWMVVHTPAGDVRVALVWNPSHQHVRVMIDAPRDWKIDRDGGKIIS